MIFDLAELLAAHGFLRERDEREIVRGPLAPDHCGNHCIPPRIRMQVLGMNRCERVSVHVRDPPLVMRVYVHF